MTAAYDRDTLEEFVDRYLEAMVAGEPDRLPLADDVVFVENHQQLEVGDGLWRTASGLGGYRNYICDPEWGQVVLLGIVEEQGEPIILDLRLAIEDDLITEIETLAIRSPQSAELYEEKGEPHPRFLESVPPDEQLPRERLIELANRYFSGMERNDPEGDYSFFHPDCDRWEHARLVTNREEGIPYGHVGDDEFTTLSAEAQFQTGFLGFVTRIRDRRFVVDVERQTVFAFCAFDHNGTVREVPGPGDEMSTVPPYFSTPRSLPVGEAFRIKDGQIYMIEATLNEAPYGTQPVFPSGDNWVEEANIASKIAAAPSEEPCDRTCLEAIVDRFREALAHNDASRLPVAPSIEYTENGQRLPLNDGLWGSVTELGDYDLRVADPDTGTVVCYGTVVEHDVPGVLVARLQVERRRVTEIEAVIVRREIEEVGPGNTQSMFMPILPHQNDPAAFQQVDPVFREDLPSDARGSVDELLAITESYYDGLRGDAVESTHFTDDCLRRVNGAQVTNVDDAPAPDPDQPEFRPQALSCAEQLQSQWFDDVETVRDVRTWVVDRERGIVARSAMLDMPNDGEEIPYRAIGAGADATTTDKESADGEGFGGTYASVSGPYSILSVQLFAIRDGRIERIEEQQRTVPYRMRSGWA